MLFKRPAFTAVVVIVLALGIGASTAIFSVVNAVLLKPLPYENADRLVWIWETNPKAEIETEPLSTPNYLDYKTRNQSFDDMGAFASSSITLTAADGEPERIPIAYVTDSFFSTLGAEALTGRTFMPEEDKPNNNRFVVLSHGLWQRRFNSNPAIIDNAITLNGNPYTVVGVMPPEFQTPQPGSRRPAQMWLPLGADYARDGRRADFLGVVARLKPDVSLEQASADMNTIAANLEQEYPQANAGFSIIALSLHERFVGNIRPTLIVLFGAVGFLLLIACVNVANLLLARSASRQKEIAIRTALGAKRGRVAQQLLTESVILSIAGGALGLIVGIWGVELLMALAPTNIPRLAEVTVDGRVLGFALAVSVLTGILFGLAPALQASNPNLNETLKEGGRGGAEGVRGGRLRRVLVAAEIALALVPLIGAGLMVKSFMKLQDVNPGFNPNRMLTVDLLLPASKYKENAQVTAFYQQLLGGVKAMPGVEAASAIDTIPLSGGGNVLAFQIENRPPQNVDTIPDAEVRVVTPEYFNTMNIPLVSGRLLSEQDSDKSPVAVIVNETLARRYFPDEDPIGKRVNLGNPQTSPWRTIVGVVRDTRQSEINKEPYSQMYGVHMQVPRRAMSLLVRTNNNPLDLVAAIRSQVTEMDASLPLYNIRTMEQILADSIATPRFNMLLMGIFAVVALMLAAIGIYGVMSYAVAQRTHEIGVRMALGASSGDVLKMIVRQGMTLTLIGVVAGLGMAMGLAWSISTLLSELLYDVGGTDPVTFAAIAIILSAVALVACLVPARRATRVDPMVALRYE
jgi:putative ABC transport system permease protein